jgi:catalase-peroxidase
MPSNRDWWSNYLNLSILHQHSPQANPLGESFNYAEEFKSLDLAALRADIFELMTTSQDWWPADYELCTGFLSLVSATLTCSNFERG